MKKALLILGIIVAIIILGISGLLIYLKAALPNVGPAEDIKVEVTPERIERGKYLAFNVMMCMDCHAHRDFTQFSGPPKPGTLGAGGDVFDQTMNFPGRFVARNITPYALGDWTDGEIIRAITTGVSKDGSAIFPVMPYHDYGKLDIEDIKSVVAFLRTLEPIKSENEPSNPDFPMNFILNTMPQKANFSKMPSRADQVGYGKYMFTAAACAECHTNRVKGKVVGEYLAGGFEFNFPDGSVLRSSNITPDKETGIGNWSKEDFVQRFKMHYSEDYTSYPVAPGEFQSIMPWVMYAGMETEDLEAIYDYLRTVPAVKSNIVRYSPSSGKY